MIKGKDKIILNIFYLAAVIFFAAFIFLPAIYVLKYFSNFKLFSNPLVINAVLFSFKIGFAVVIIDLLFGVPLAWLFVKSKSRFIKYLDHLVDISLIVPTAALGFSIYLYWGTNSGLARLFALEDGLVSRGPLMIILLHIVFTLPYVIRAVAVAIAQIDQAYEEAAATLGASPLAAFRTVALPLFRDGVINGAILAFTRSLSETGATMMVAGAFMTAPVLIINLKDQGQLFEAAGVSAFLIFSAVIFLLIAKSLLGQRTIKIQHAFPALEQAASKLSPLKNILIIAFFILVIILPAVYIILYNLFNFEPLNVGIVAKSLAVSLLVAVVVMLVNAFFCLPLAYFAARNRFKLEKILDSLNEAVLLMPTSALGLSLALFWKQFLSSGILILILAHLSFTFPLAWKPVKTAFRDIAESQEEAAYSLGANTRKMFSTILLPQIKPALISGACLAFMRSLSETGATLAVSENIKTTSVLIVDLFKQNKYDEVAFVCLALIAVSIFSLAVIKKIDFMRPFLKRK